MKERGGRCVSRVEGARARARACASVFARWSGEVCAEGGVCGGASRVRGRCVWRLCCKSYMCFLLGLVHMEMPRLDAAVPIPTH